MKLPLSASSVQSIMTLTGYMQLVILKALEFLSEGETVCPALSYINSYDLHIVHFKRGHVSARQLLLFLCISLGLLEERNITPHL